MAEEFVVEITGGTQESGRTETTVSTSGKVMELLESELRELDDGCMIIITRQGPAESSQIIEGPPTG